MGVGMWEGESAIREGGGVLSGEGSELKSPCRKPQKFILKTVYEHY